MLPTCQELVDEAEAILVTAQGRAMYAAVLATAIAGRLNQQAHTPQYEPPPWEVLLAALASDPRYTITEGVAGLPIVGCTSISSHLPTSGTHRVASPESDSEPESDSKLGAAS
jgi:hypothetical protein